MKMNFLNLSLIFIVFGTFFQTAFAADNYSNSVAIIHVNKQAVDKKSPWQSSNVSRGSYLATMVGQNQFLTSAMALAGAKYIELQRFGKNEKLQLEVLFKDYEANLAILKAVDPKKVADMRPIRVGVHELNLKDEVTIYHSRSVVKLYDRKSIVRTVTVNSGPSSPYYYPFYNLEVNDKSGFGWAEPVLKNGALVGIAVVQNDNIVKAIPASIIAHFLKDQRSQKYRGFPFLGVSTVRLTSPFEKALLNMDIKDNGVKVIDVFPNSPFLGKLKKDDVIVAVKGRQLDAHGNYQHVKWGKIYLSYLLSKMYAGDMLQMKVLRNGEKMKFNAKLGRYNRNRSLVPYFRPDQAVPHIIVGGLVFQELSRPYLQIWGPSWNVKAPDRLLYQWFYKNEPQEDPSKKIIFLNRVIADEFNRGYEGYQNIVVESVNEIEADSIESIRQALTTNPIVKNGKKYALIRLKFGFGSILLPYNGLQEAHKRISESYSIPKSSSSFFSL